jgi:heme oxygenase (biliverdin-IX-beta and delta-forming)
MLLATALDNPIGVKTARSFGLRDRLREATTADHRELDTRFAAFDLLDSVGYRRFLQASAAALLPLEAALEDSGVAGIFGDWAQRARSATIIADVERLGGSILPFHRIGTLNRARLFGVLYVLEGSRLGARFLLRMIERAADPEIHAATAYLRHGAGQALWPNFLAKLEAEAATSCDCSETIAGARWAFAMFAQAAARA